ncbi:dimethyl sulfoxide reductase anchor subunit family protein [Microbaculum marinum]|uniref:DmsC/YnfH family molybdoenzyme membrane anchor subunit n=1 Tax=Microbaculum marinum TaxID=1764581 RepID=A0AAW9RYR4_9HYPH
MHPAISVIFFTTASGAGYGLLALTGIGLALGLVPADRLFGLIALGLALTLVTAGLLASTLHLGHPERAWRAFSQWRSSWLSREGVASVLTYVPAAVFAAGWVLFGRTGSMIVLAGLLAALGALVTVYTTSMIYASLRTIPEWANGYTTPVYLLLAAMSGAVLLNAVAAMFGGEPVVGWVAAALLAAGWALKLAAWRANDTRAPPVTAGRATGLGDGAVRSIEWPHTAENYVLKEMGYRVARKHARQLRRIAWICAFAVPLALVLVSLAAGGAAAIAAASAACVFAGLGLVVERWLFFAEARHVAALYYRPAV